MHLEKDLVNQFSLFRYRKYILPVDHDSSVVSSDQAADQHAKGSSGSIDDSGSSQASGSTIPPGGGGSGADVNEARTPEMEQKQNEHEEPPADATSGPRRGTEQMDAIYKPPAEEEVEWHCMCHFDGKLMVADEAGGAGQHDGRPAGQGEVIAPQGL